MDSPWSPLQLMENATLPSLLLFSYFFGCAANIANYVGYFRFHSDIYGKDLPRAYLAFVIIGTATYVLFSGTMWLWAAKYSSTREERADKLRNGVIAIFFLKDLPLFIAEYHAILCCGWLNGYQGFAFIFQLLFVLFSFVFTWLAITWKGSEWLQMNFGGVQGLKTGTEQIVIFSPPPPGVGTQRFVPLASPAPTEWRSPSAADLQQHAPQQQPQQQGSMYALQQQQQQQGFRQGPTRQQMHRRHPMEDDDDHDDHGSAYAPPAPVPMRADPTLSRQQQQYDQPHQQQQQTFHAAAASPRGAGTDQHHRDVFHAELQSSGRSGSHADTPHRFLVVPEQHGSPSGGSGSRQSSPSGGRAFSPRDQQPALFVPSPFRGQFADGQQPRHSPGGTAVMVERHVF